MHTSRVPKNNKYFAAVSSWENGGMLSPTNSKLKYKYKINIFVSGWESMGS